MKQIDWVKVSSKNTLRHAFSVDVKNRFETLSDPSDDIEIRYNNLITYTEEIAISTLPKKETIKNTSLCDDARVRDARKDLEKAKQKYEKIPTRSAFKETTKAQVKSKTR